MQKGDKVTIKAQVIGRSTSVREVIRIPYLQPRKGIVLGYSFIFTGKLINTNLYYDEEPHLHVTGSQKVWVVELLERGERYLQPIRCLESDLENDQKNQRIEKCRKTRHIISTINNSYRFKIY